MDAQEQAARAEAFREASQNAHSATPFVSEASESPDAVDQVQIAVIGEGQLHLRGPLEGVNAIAHMVHELDQPIGQVKIGIHVLQFTGSEDTALEDVRGNLDRSLGYMRQMIQTSQTLFRTALSNVAARYQSSDPHRFEEAFFYGPCIRNFRKLNGQQAAAVDCVARLARYCHDALPRGLGHSGSATRDSDGVPPAGSGRIAKIA